jgi:uroporphyrinogen decarboxylase
LREASLRQIEAYPSPNAPDPRRVEGLREEASRLRQDGRCAVIGRSATMGFFEVGCALRGMDQYLMDMVEQPALIEALNEKVLQAQMELYGAYLDACGEYLDVIETGDDYGGGAGPLISPAMFRRLLKPYRARLNIFIRKKTPHIRIFHHTCGNVRLLIRDLIDIGVDVLNPVQPVRGMEPAQLARDFGASICFHGGVDTITVLRGSAARVQEATRRLCQDFAGSSWIVAPANHLQDDIPVENIAVLFETVRACAR